MVQRYNRKDLVVSTTNIITGKGTVILEGTKGLVRMVTSTPEGYEYTIRWEEDSRGEAVHAPAHHNQIAKTG